MYLQNVMILLPTLVRVLSTHLDPLFITKPVTIYPNIARSHPHWQENTHPLTEKAMAWQHNRDTTHIHKHTVPMLLLTKILAAHIVRHATDL